MYDNTGTIECRIVMCYILEEYIIEGASGYMWHEGSHSSDVYWFRAKLEWEKGGQENDHWGEGGSSKTFVHK